MEITARDIPAPLDRPLVPASAEQVQADLRDVAQTLALVGLAQMIHGKNTPTGVQIGDDFVDWEALQPRLIAFLADSPQAPPEPVEAARVSATRRELLAALEDETLTPSRRLKHALDVLGRTPEPELWPEAERQGFGPGEAEFNRVHGELTQRLDSADAMLNAIALMAEQARNYTQPK